MTAGPPAMRRVIGIDPGLAATGYGIIDGDGVRASAVVSGVIRTKPRAPRAERLAEIFEAIGRLIEEYHPHELAVEQQFVAENVRTAMVIGEVRAIAMVAGATRGLAVYEFPVATIKQTVAGYGTAPKSQVQAMIAMHLGAVNTPVSLDASDALAVALTRLASMRIEAMMAARPPVPRPSVARPAVPRPVQARPA